MINQFEEGLSVSYCCKKLVDSLLVKSIGTSGRPFLAFSTSVELIFTSHGLVD